MQYLFQKARPGGRKSACGNSARTARCCEDVIDGFSGRLARVEAFQDGSNGRIQFRPSYVEWTSIEQQQNNRSVTVCWET